MEEKEKLSTFEGETQMPDNHMPLAIGSLLIGCIGAPPLGLIIGIFAVYFSNNVKKYFEANDFVDAQKSAKMAKTLAYVNLVIVVIALIASWVFYDDLKNWYDGVFIKK